MFLTVRNCFCFFSLTRGTIIVGFLEVVGALGYLISGIFLVSDPQAYGSNVAKAVGALLVVTGALLLLFAISLLVGVLKGKPMLLVPWMAYILTAAIGNTFLNIISAAQDTEKGYNTSGALNSVVAIIALILQFYFLVVVYSLYTDVKGPQQANHTTTSSGSTTRTSAT